MHTLFEEVLRGRDLSKAGMLFSLEDKDIEEDLSDVVQGIHSIADSEEYEISDNDQSVVEICITRVSTAIRETGSIEKHSKALVELLAMCRNHRLAQANKDEDPPHAKIASDIMSCLFMYYNKSSVMEMAIPAAVKLLDCDNRDLCRSVSSYLSLAAIDNVNLLAEHTKIIVSSVLGGNYMLGQVLPQVYLQNPAPVHQHLGELVRVVERCENNDRVYFLQLMGAVAKKEPKLLEEHIGTLCKYLSTPLLSPILLTTFVDLAVTSPTCLLPHRAAITGAVKQQPALICQVAQIMGALGTVDEEEGEKSMETLVAHLSDTDPTLLPVVLQEVRGLALAHHHLLPPAMPHVQPLANSGSSAVRLLVQQIKEDHKKYVGEKEVRSVSSQTEGTVTIITVGNPPNATHPSGTISIKHTLLPPSGADSQQSLGKASSGSTVRLACDHRAGSPTSTLVSDTTSLTPHTAAAVSGPDEGQRDGVQQFCEKHLTKIKSFIKKLSANIPLPAKCSVVNGKHKRYVRLYFVCEQQSGQCLYSSQHFILNTRLPKLWIHLMFLSVQANAASALSQRDTDVSCLKACWDALKGERNSSFLTVVTSSFPTQKDQLALLHELHEERYFDVFEFNAACAHWACFMCNHPEKVSSLLQDGFPEMAGQLKEKKGKWKVFKRWKTRYFTLSGGTFTYSKSNSKESVPVSKIQSVKAVRKGIRDIPRAFEIFTDDQSYVFKAKGQQDVEQWVQCLHIALVRSHMTDSLERPPLRGSASLPARPLSLMSNTKL
ncbi:ventricular zone-expressed PH domain-containing protein homolog 1-like isoform X2 [Babylonia areolata]|uniref:ventricular zone-expressed PH domain-containing protein homolog 1-like isoform X2 n=1 Tax=Babylonia areolata TaxID=304850 RepID=UPI003FD49F4C